MDLATIASRHKTQADRYLAEAEKYESRIHSCHQRPSEEQCEKLVEKFESAAKTYKLAQEWNAAALCFRRAAEYTSGFEAKRHWMDCAKCHHKNGDASEALNAYQSCVPLLQQHRELGKIYEQMASIHQKESDEKRTIEYLEKAINSYRADDCHATANSLQSTLADLYIHQNQYRQAQTTLEELCQQSSDNTSTRWSVPDYLLKAELCRRITEDKIDELEEKSQSLTYADAYPLFGSSTQCRFLEKLKTVETVDEFETLLADYPNFTRTPTLVQLLSELKKQLTTVDFR